MGAPFDAGYAIPNKSNDSQMKLKSSLMKLKSLLLNR
jgi:hypothetical protein